MTCGLSGRTLPSASAVPVKNEMPECSRVQEGNSCKLGLLGKGLLPRALDLVRSPTSSCSDEVKANHDHGR